MPVIALFTWIATALGGLFLLAIWLIEYDPDFQRAAATRLPIPVISGHVLCAVAGLVAWILYLVTDKDSYAWVTVVLLGAVAVLGLTMAFRWLGVYRSSPLPKRMPPPLPAPPISRRPRDAWTRFSHGRPPVPATPRPSGPPISRFRLSGTSRWPW